MNTNQKYMLINDRVIRNILLTSLLIIVRSMVLMWAQSNSTIATIYASWEFNNEGAGFGGTWNCSISAAGDFSLSSSTSSNIILSPNGYDPWGSGTCQVINDSYYYSAQGGASVTITANAMNGGTGGPSGDETDIIVKSLDGKLIAKTPLTYNSQTFTFSLPTNGAVVSIDPVTVDSMATGIESTVTFYPDSAPVITGAPVSLSWNAPPRTLVSLCRALQESRFHLLMSVGSLLSSMVSRRGKIQVSFPARVQALLLLLFHTTELIRSPRRTP